MATKKIEDGIRSYLDSVGVSQKPVVDREAVKALKVQIRDEPDSLGKLRLLKDSYRCLLSRLVNGDIAWILFEGRPGRWLNDALRAAVEQWDPHQGHISKSDHEAVLCLLKRLQRLTEYRNAVVHGTWQNASMWLPDEPNRTQTFDVAKPAQAERAVFLNKSRESKERIEYKVTVSEIEALAQELGEANKTLWLRLS